MNRSCSLRLGAFVAFLVLMLVNGPTARTAEPESSDELVLGVFPRRSQALTVAMFTPIAEHLSAVLGRKVRLETSHDFLSFWDAVAEQRFDIVHYNQYHYVRAHKEFGHRAIVRNEEFGQSTISGSLVTRRDSGLHSLSDLRGRKIIFGGGKDAMMSYIVAKYLLQEAGLRDGDYITQFALNPPKACVAVYYRQGAAGGVGHIVLHLATVKNKIDVDEMKYLGRSEPLAHLPWAVAATIPADLGRKIQKALVDLGSTAQGRAILKNAALSGLVQTQDADYDPHRHIIWVVTGEKY